MITAQCRRAPVPAAPPPWCPPATSPSPAGRPGSGCPGRGRRAVERLQRYLSAWAREADVHRPPIIASINRNTKPGPLPLTAVAMRLFRTRRTSPRCGATARAPAPAAPRHARCCVPRSSLRRHRGVRHHPHDPVVVELRAIVSIRTPAMIGGAPRRMLPSPGACPGAHREDDEVRPGHCLATVRHANPVLTEAGSAGVPHLAPPRRPGEYCPVNCCEDGLSPSAPRLSWQPL
jgi:hypothetical protein